MQQKRQITHDDKVMIGLEIHGYLTTKEKLFCRCPADYKGTDTAPNTNICPVCTGYPGSKPMLPNGEAFRKVVAIALMMGCTLSSKALVWQRKHYDWPDLPKGYQNTMSGAYSIPVGEEGSFLGIRIREVHIEEDPAAWDPETGHVDYNRSGLPLVEIVTEPDFKNSKEVREWVKKLITTLSYINAVPDDAGIKADVNVSVGSERVEVKNVNSMYSMEKTIEYEIARQKSELNAGRQVKRETRAFDEKRKITLSMRDKEQAADYRFIPDPDLPVIILNQELVKKIEKGLPELPHVKIERFMREHDIDKEIAEVISKDKEIAEFYENVIEQGIDKRLASYWTAIELLRVLNWNKKALDEVDINPAHFAELLKLLEEKKITENAAKHMLNDFVPKSFSPQERMKTAGRITDNAEIENICKEIMQKNQKAVIDYTAGEAKALDFLIGQVMAATRGRADNKTVRDTIVTLLG